MDRHDAVEAVKLVGAPTVIPCHYDTFPPIEADAEAFKSDVEGADVVEGRLCSDPGEGDRGVEEGRPAHSPLRRGPGHRHAGGLRGCGDDEGAGVGRGGGR